MEPATKNNTTENTSIKIIVEDHEANDGSQNAKQIEQMEREVFLNEHEVDNSLQSK